MNSTFKVVFNKARGALMVVNEVTSSVQGKGTKTVVAAAVATMIAGVAGTAMAEEGTTTAPEANKTTINVTNQDAVKDKDEFDGYKSGVIAGLNNPDYRAGALYIAGNKTINFQEGVKFTNNTSEAGGGAMEVHGGATVNLKDAVITGNKADTWGGAIRIAGKSTVNLEVKKDTVYAGNKANVNGKEPYPDMGDFAYLNGSANLNLTASGDATLTIADSIASAAPGNLIKTNGNVNVTGSMESYSGDITVESGKFKLAGGYGSFDNWTIYKSKSDVEAAKKNSAATATLTVKDGATAELGALKVTRKTASGEAGTNLVVENGGTLTVESITVTSQQYVNKEKNFDWTSHGSGKLTNNGTATVKDHITVEAGGKFEMTGDVTVGRINVAAKTDKLDAGILTGGDLTLNNGKSVNKGKVTLDHLELTNGSYFETTSNFAEKDKEEKAKDSFFKATSIYVGEGATLAFTDFNSNVQNGRDGNVENAVNDQVLVNSHLELDGGSLNGLKNLKIGTTATAGGKLTVTYGDYAFDNLTIAYGGDDSHQTLETEIFGGSLNVKSLYIDADVEQHDGTVTVTDTLKLEGKSQWHMNGGTLVFDKALKIENVVPNEQPEGTRQIVVDGGELQAWNSQIFGVKADKTDYETLAKTGSQIMTGEDGFLTILDNVEMTTAEVEKAVKSFAKGNLTFQNLTLKTGADEKVVFDQKYGTALLDRAVEAPAASADGTVALTIDDGKAAGVGALKVDAKTKNVKAEKGHLILGGLGGNVIEGVAEVETLEAKHLSLGKTEASSGVVNAAKLTADKLNVNGDFSARAVDAAEATINGMLTADSVKTANGTVTGALVLTGNVKKEASELAGTVNVTDFGVLTTNRAAGLAYAAGYADEDLSVAYVDRQLKLAKGAVINIGAANGAVTLAANGDVATEPAVNVNANGIYGIDAASFLYTGKPAADADVSVFGNSTAVNLNGGEVEILNVSKLGQIDLGGAITNTDGSIDTDSIYVVVEKDGINADTGVVTLGYNNGLVADKTVDARLKDAFTNGISAKELAILDALDTPAFFNDETNKFTADGNKAFEQATGGNATAGVLNVAYDANAQVTDAIVRHQLSEHAGMGVWADVFYAKNEAKELYGDFGYSADIYGGVLGFDYTAACGGTLGAALTVGTADADSEGGVLSTSLSSDFVGLSVYASKDFSGLNVKADLGYIDFSNDFTGLGDASDATTITFGVRGDFTAYQNGAFSVVPHMGLRYTRIDTDATAFNDEQDMNVLEAPIGVKLAGTFEATGWKLVPSYDFTIVPQLGDKEVEAFGTAGDITILSGGLFNNVLGVEAVKDNMSFGLNASYGFGPDDRANTQVNANFRYHF